MELEFDMLDIAKKPVKYFQFLKKKIGNLFFFLAEFTNSKQPIIGLKEF